MVSLTSVISSNSLISSSLPPGLVAVFIGATSGIGEITLKKLAKYTRQPRAYFVGRSQDAADRIMAECKALNPAGEYIFIKADASLIRVVDEHLHLLAALNYYSRLRFITSLLPLLQQAHSLRRIITVGGGTNEGPVDSTDFQALRVPLPQLRGHLTSLITLGLEAVARTAPNVSFVHDYPGTVRTPFLNYMSEEQFKVYESKMVEVDESGERHLYMATSARFPPKDGREEAVPLGEGVGVAVGTTGMMGSGVYSIGADCESASSDVLEILKELREKRMGEEVWKHTEGEYERISRVDKKVEV